ncbi:MAG TPA: methyltransferase domain-containing protein, partial [Ignavibacteria bacterium]|nr:methyltransferase domain-containing protein [Ignavibacteria bacterium]
MHNIDDPAFQDNRMYNYNDTINVEREEYIKIVELIPERAKIIDLGCGNGNLIEMLINKKSVSAVGIDISDSGISECKRKGLDAVQGAIDKKLD